MIWGITLEPGQAHTQVIEDEVHLSMATMESRGCIGSKADNFSHVVIKTGTTEYLLCTLVNGITYQQCLDLKLMPSDKVTFSVQGTNVVYLTGYSFASSETEQEIIQTEDWIDNPVLEGDISQDNLAYAEDAGSFQPSEVQNEVQRQHQQTKGDEVDISDREKFSVEFEVPAEEEYQYIPERVHQQVTDGTPCTSSQGQPQDHHPPPGTVAGGSGVEIKEEIHTVVETEEDIITDQPIEDVPGQSGHQSIHQPSTSAGVIRVSVASDGSYAEVWGHSNMAVEKQFFGNRSNSSDNRGQQIDVCLPQSKERSQDRRGSGRPARKQTWDKGRKTMAARTSDEGNWVATRWVGDKGSFVCNYCGKGFRDIASKEEHETKHQCRYCKKSFNMTRQREQHELIHTGERPYKCSFCSRGFRDASSKVQHERIHTGEKPYKCRHCGMCFTHRESKRRHEKAHLDD